MGKPRPPFALVDAEGLQPVEQSPGEPPGLTRAVLEDEHPDTARLAVAAGREDDLAGVPGRSSQRGRNRRQFGCRAPSEEGEREVEMLERDDPPVAKVLGLPRFERVEDVAGEAQGAEETQVLIALDATA